MIDVLTKKAKKFFKTKKSITGRFFLLFFKSGIIKIDLIFRKLK